MGVLVLLLSCLLLGLGQGKGLYGYAQLCNPGCGTNGFAKLNPATGENELVFSFPSSITTNALDTFWVG
jgi:hypothetical protein